MGSNPLLTRRHLLTAGTGCVLALAYAPGAHAARERLVVRMEQEFVPFDPANRRGPTEIEVLECVSRRLVRLVPGGTTAIEKDAAARIEQTSPTTIDFELQSGITWGDGFGELTADDVKFSYE